MDVLLEEMSAQDFTGRRAELVRDSADALRASRGLSVPEAESEAERAVAAQLPRGPQTPGQLLRTAVTGGEVVGWIWISLPGTTYPDLAWVSDVEVDEPYRKRGAGQAIMRAGEMLLTDRGHDEVGLNVYGGNDPAIRLYRRLGYEVVRQQRARALGDVPGTHETPVTIAPDGTATADGRRVGRVVFVEQHPQRPFMGWISEFEAEKGYGPAVLGEVERILVRRGVRSLGIDVPGDDRSLQRMVQKHGFEVLAQQMRKHLDP
jgi:mycothiol synthase